MLDLALLAVAVTAESSTSANVILTEPQPLEIIPAPPPYTIWSGQHGDTAEFAPSYMETGRQYPISLNGAIYVVQKTEDGDLEIFGEE